MQANRVNPSLQATVSIRSRFLATVTLLCLLSCGSDETVELRVMTFNIEWGGTNVSFDNVVETIRLSNADIVGIQEAEGNLQRLAAELGWHYDAQNYAISRFPIFDAPHADRRFVLVELRPGRVVALANVHLPSDPYGPQLVRDGGTIDEVLELENTTRLKPLLPYLDALKPVIRAEMPVFLTGDFNAPSHKDWTERMVGVRPFIKYTVDWPVSRAVEAAGLKDSWRVAHPDPKTAPGLTWWAARPPLELYSPGDNDPQDRIDFVWFAGSAELLSSELIGEDNVSPWPSDHRAVVSTFRVVPAAAPRLIDVGQRIYDDDAHIVITYRLAQRSTIEISGRHRSVVSGDGQLQFDASNLEVGHYRVSMQTPGAETINSEFWVIDRESTPDVAVASDVYRVGEAIDIQWRNGPGNRNDYLGIYELGAPSDYNPDHDGGVTWLYVNALPAGTIILDETTSESVWPLKPGTYVVRLMKDDGYDVLAESLPFTIR